MMLSVHKNDLQTLCAKDEQPNATLWLQIGLYKGKMAEIQYK